MTKQEAELLSHKHPILFYDGVCQLCHQSVNFLIQRDKKGNLRFAHLQSSLAKDIFGKDFNAETPESIYVLHKGKILEKSTGILVSLKYLGGFYPLLYSFIIIPRFIRNFIYDYIASHRYQWFGKHESCLLPTPQIKSKFID